MNNKPEADNKVFIIRGLTKTYMMGEVPISARSRFF